MALTPSQQSKIQAEIQRELERREWAEPDDNVMAEYITVLLANGSSQERVQTEMDDLVGSDFDPKFLDWLFGLASDVAAPAQSKPARSPSPPRSSDHSSERRSRLLDSALGGLSNQPETNKRKSDAQDGAAVKRKSLNAPEGPRSMGTEGRRLQDRMGLAPGRGPMQVRGSAGVRGPPSRGPAANGGMPGPAGGYNNGFRRQDTGNQAFGGMFQPGQQEMMAQMMMMQASMAQMGQMMQSMAAERQQTQIAQPAPVRPPPPAKVPAGTKLGTHSVSTTVPKPSGPGPIPDKPSSKALCRYSVGCSNARCPYSHPSPVADEQTGMVLSEESCENGKKCKDAECTKSHVSPAAVLGDAAGPSRLLCKYQNCTNPSCPFRHEDESGKSIPPPALSASKKARTIPAQAPVVPSASSDNEDGDVEVVMTSKNLMHEALDDSKPKAPCRYGERCTRPDCFFSHPASRTLPKSNKRFSGRRPSGNATNVDAIGGGMNISKKFQAESSKLDPSASDFHPQKTTDLEVTS